MSKNLTYLGIQNPFESDESKHHFKTYLAKYAEEVIRLACNRFTKLPKVGTLQEKCSRFKKKISQGSHNNCCTVCKRIYLQRIKPYQLARSLLLQEAPTFHILKMPCRRFYTSLHSTVTSFNFHAQSQATQRLPSSWNSGNIQFPSGIKLSSAPRSTSSIKN